MIEIEQGTGKYVTIAADEETALRWSGDIGFKMMQYNQIRCMQKPAYLWTRR